MSVTDLDDETPAQAQVGGTTFILWGGVLFFAITQSILFVIFGPLARDLGLTEFQFGLIFTISNIGLVVASPFWGRKSDSWGRKPVFLIGILGCGGGIGLMALVIQIGLWGLVSTSVLFFLLLAARSVYTLASTAVYPSSASFIAATTDRENRVKGMAMLGSARSLGAIIGPGLGGSLAFVSVLFPIYFAAGLIFLFAIFAQFVLVEPPRSNAHHKKPTLKSNDPRLFPYLVVWFAFFLAFTSLQFITAFFIEDKLGITETQEVVRVTGLALFSMAATALVVQGIVLQFIKPAPKTLLRLALPLFAIGLLVIAFAQSLPMMFTGYVFLGLSFSTAGPGISGGASLSVEPYEQATAAGFLASATSLGVLVGPLFGTTFYRYDPALPILMNVGILTALSFYALKIDAPSEKRIDMATQSADRFAYGVAKR